MGKFVFPGMGDSEGHRRGAILEVELARAHLRSHRLVHTRLDVDGVPHLESEQHLMEADRWQRARPGGGPGREAGQLSLRGRSIQKTLTALVLLSWGERLSTGPESRRRL